MNSVNANWMSESFQPVPACSGWTNSVHAYWRLAIMIIAIRDARSWNHRLLMFTLPSLQRGLAPLHPKTKQILPRKQNLMQNAMSPCQAP